MSAPGAHPAGDIWPGILHQFRCEAVDDGDRCQLYRNHVGAHAHAVPPPSAKIPTRRWTDDGQRWTDAVDRSGMRWCCMFAR